MFWNEEVGIRGAVPPTDASAKLIEIGESIRIGSVDQNRVSIRHVDSVFNDRRCKEKIDFTLSKTVKNGIDVVGVHLSMNHTKSYCRNEFLDCLGAAVDRLDAVVNVKSLSAARQFPHDRILNEFGVGLGDDRFDRQPILRRRVDHRHIARMDEGHVERAGDRRCRESQAVDAHFEFFQVFFRSDPKSLFFVDDDESQIFELDVLR